MSETLSHTPIVPVKAAGSMPFSMPFSMTEFAIAISGCALMAALGWALGAYLLLPFGAG